ncbi:hypothetical protein DDE82_004105 [Stemphylium lycopersici]|nr:hypothetical protein DDE82_004105 [Stemphylium lycopersici]
MDYADEDEVDWSDGTLNSPSPEPIEITTHPSHLDPFADAEKNCQSLFVADSYGEHDIPCGLPLDPTHPRVSSARLKPTQLQRARTGVRLKRRAPSKEDYSNFVLYQASQKAYETTFLRNCVAHALHQDPKDGKDGAPFFDVHSFDTSPFSKYGPANLFPVAEKVNTLWHHISSDTPIVRYSTKEYGSAHGMDPLEDVNAVANTLFRKDNFDRTLPTGRAVKLSISKKRRGQNQSGAAAREDRVIAGRGNWLDFASAYGEAEYFSPSLARRAHPGVVADSDVSGVSREPYMQSNWRNQQDTNPQILSHPGHQQNTPDISHVPPTQPQGVPEHRANDTLKPRRVDSPFQNNGTELTAKEHFWRMMHGRERRLEQSNKERMDNETTKEKIDAGAIFDERPKNKSKKKAFSSKQSTTLSNKNFAKAHPSGSRTLELYQELPPTASFERTSLDEKSAWPCGMKHTMGHYYNAGDRKSCTGCNTNVNDGHNNFISMDFYLPTRSFFYQPAPNILWKPNKPSNKPLKSSSVCHNGIAKDAYWKAMNSGATEEEALQRGVKTVVNFLVPKPPPKMPTPEPEPEPGPDLGPHISGSASMEHGQEIPDGYYWEKQSRHEELAWRCDVNHALGRYYLAGDKRSCPSCGSNKGGLGKHEVMDFYLPPGVTVRQEAPGLSKWKPRKPYNTSKPTEKKGRAVVTHNQMCSKAYFEFVAGGRQENEGLRLAIKQVDEKLGKREEDKVKAREDEHFIANKASNVQTRLSRSVSADPNPGSISVSNSYHRTSRDGHTLLLVPKKRSIDDLEEGEIDAREIFQLSNVMSYASIPRHQPEMSSSDEETSGSDSE